MRCGSENCCSHARGVGAATIGADAYGVGSDAGEAGEVIGGVGGSALQLAVKVDEPLALVSRTGSPGHGSLGFGDSAHGNGIYTRAVVDGLNMYTQYIGGVVARVSEHQTVASAGVVVERQDNLFGAGEFSAGGADAAHKGLVIVVIKDIDTESTDAGKRDAQLGCAERVGNFGQYHVMLVAGECEVGGLYTGYRGIPARREAIVGYALYIELFDVVGQAVGNTFGVEGDDGAFVVVAAARACDVHQIGGTGLKVVEAVGVDGVGHLYPCGVVGGTVLNGVAVAVANPCYRGVRGGDFLQSDDWNLAVVLVDGAVADKRYVSHYVVDIFVGGERCHVVGIVVVAVAVDATSDMAAE